ncbi:MAG TPA: hypothetical protein VLE21_05185 [Candidatus Nitrosocosmicus sp.]|nr:hypothetical protein [Candidatus Nitrosocosmicus sp.]
MTKEKFEKVSEELISIFPEGFEKETIKAALNMFIQACDGKGLIDSLYPPSLEALKAEPWRYLIADPRDPRAKALIGKKVFHSLYVSFECRKYDTGVLFDVVTANEIRLFSVSNRAELAEFIWPAPIDMQEICETNQDATADLEDKE